jgi:hypothetical protein
MKVKLEEAGFETYTGQMGVIFFENGLSTNEVLVIDAVKLSCVMRVTWEDGTSPSVTQSILDNANTPAPLVADGRVVTPKGGVIEKKVTANQVIADTGYSEAQLGKIADKDGVGGLRVIADELKVKGKSIKELIDGILKAQEGK